jgi:hypothetical protein
VVEYDHALGTEYNGFLLFEADSSDLLLDGWSNLKIKSDGMWSRHIQ